jgi:hypothetical protein
VSSIVIPPPSAVKFPPGRWSFRACPSTSLRAGEIYTPGDPAAGGSAGVSLHRDTPPYAVVFPPSQAIHRFLGMTAQWAGMLRELILPLKGRWYPSS